MGRRQSIGGPIVSVNLELLRAVHPLEGGEALQRNLAGPRHELNQLGPFCLVEGSEGAPEPLNLPKETARIRSALIPVRLEGSSSLMAPVAFQTTRPYIHCA